MPAPSDVTSMALFCDFENIALGVRDANYEKLDIRRILERLLLKGSIVVKKAYCDWERYKAFKAPMHEANFELIEIPHVRQSGKNSADIRMVVDALDLCYTKEHVDTFVIISGDSDFSPLVSKLRENAKTVIGVGVKNSTSDLLIANCDEFIYYDDLVREQRKGRRSSVARETVRDAARPAKDASEGKDGARNGAKDAMPAKAATKEGVKGTTRSAKEAGAAARTAKAKGAPKDAEGPVKDAEDAAKDATKPPSSRAAAAAAAKPVKATAARSRRRPTGAVAAENSDAPDPTTAASSPSAGEPELRAAPEPTTDAEVPAAAVAGSRSDPEYLRQTGIAIVVDTLEALASERGSERVFGSMIKQAIKRVRPQFSESFHGFRSFNAMLEAAQAAGALDLERDEKSGGYVVRLRGADA